MPAGALAWSVVDLEDVLGRPGGELVDRLAGAPTWADRFAVLDAVLARRRGAARGPRPPEVARAWDRLVASGGTVDVRSAGRGRWAGAGAT